MNKASKLSIKLTKVEYDYIKSQADKTGHPLSTYCRDVLLGHKVQDTLPRQEIGKIMCIYHNRIDDAETLSDAKKEAHEMEKQIWQSIE